VKFTFDNVITSNLNLIIERYLPKQVLYTEKEGYVIIKKYDEGKTLYVCKVKQGDEQEEKANVKE
jgi:hypothetical protein